MEKQFFAFIWQISKVMYIPELWFEEYFDSVVIIPSQFALSTFDCVYYNMVTIELGIFPISF